MSGKIEIAFSACCYPEVCKQPTIKASSEDSISSYFEHDYLLPVALDTAVGEFSRTLMMANYSGLKPQDAVHLATAAYINAGELHTFDKKLLALDGMIDRKDGTKLKICWPEVSEPAGPLLKEMKKGPKED